MHSQNAMMKMMMVMMMIHHMDRGRHRMGMGRIREDRNEAERQHECNGKGGAGEERIGKEAGEGRRGGERREDGNGGTR